MPGADEGAVVNLAQREDGDPSVLLRGVHEAIDASDRLEVTDLSASHDGGAALYKSGIDVPRSFVRSGGEGATPIPISLFRRRMVEGGHVDEVLRDVGNWQPDSRRGIANALAFPLESDLEEVTADEAAQFGGTVRARRYVPFRSHRGPAPGEGRERSEEVR